MNDIEKLLGTLNDPKGELYWDECWDCLMEVREVSDETIIHLLKALAGQTEIARIAAIRKLRQLHVDGALWTTRLCNLLADSDAEVRSEALDAAKPFLNSSLELAAAVKRMRGRNGEFLSLRIKAWWYLWRLRSAENRKREPETGQF
jgi:hypothetical protein